MDTECCKICGSELEFLRFEGNWKVFECPTCETEIKRSTGTVGSDGFSKEDLRDLSDF